MISAYNWEILNLRVKVVVMAIGRLRGMLVV
jgi:hypothetical protein